MYNLLINIFNSEKRGFLKKFIKKNNSTTKALKTIILNIFRLIIDTRILL